MTGKIIIVLHIALFGIFNSCSNPSSKHMISYMSFSINGQDGDTAYAMAWEIKDNGNVYLHGGTRSANPGNHNGKLSIKNLDRIYSDFFKLKTDSSETFGIVDYRSGNNFDFQFKNGNHVFIWKGEYSKLPNELHEFLQICFKRIKQVKLEKSDLLHSYHTNAHLKHNKNLRDIEWKEE